MSKFSVHLTTPPSFEDVSPIQMIISYKHQGIDMSFIVVDDFVLDTVRVNEDNFSTVPMNDKIFIDYLTKIRCEIIAETKNRFPSSWGEFGTGIFEFAKNVTVFANCKDYDEFDENIESIIDERLMETHLLS